MKDLNNIKIHDIQDNEGGDAYENFKQKLMGVEQFPTLYTFKFIVPAEQDAKQEIEALFTHPSTKMHSKDSKTGKYKSLTIETFVNTADDVIDYYKKVSSIKNVIMM